MSKRLDSLTPESYIITGLLKVVIRKFRKRTGINLKPYHDCLRPWYWPTTSGKYIRLNLKSWGADPLGLLNYYYYIPDGVMPGAAQLYALYDCYRRAKVIEITEERVGKSRFYEFAPWARNEKPKTHPFLLRMNLIRSPTCQAVMVTAEHDAPCPVAGRPLPDIPDTPDYILELYTKYETKFNDPKPFSDFRDSRMRGAGIDGFCNAMGELARVRTCPTLDFNPFYLAVQTGYEMHGYQPGKTFTFPNYTPGCYDTVDFDPKTSGGFVPTHTVSIQGKEANYIYSGNASKGKMKSVAVMENEAVLKKILEKYDAEDYTFDPDLYGIVIYLPNLKVEAGGPGDDPYKERIFFIPPLWKFLRDKYLLQGLIKYEKRRGCNAQGLQWFGGDAQRIFNCIFDFQYLYDYDSSRFNQSELALPLAIITGYNWLLYSGNKKSSKNAFVFYHHLRQLVADAVSKLVQWPTNDWRVIIGMMMSGNYDTSPTDNRYHTTMVLCFIICVADSMIRTGQHYYEDIQMTGIEFGNYLRDQLKLLTQLCINTKILESEEFRKKVDIMFFTSGDDGMICLRYAKFRPYLGLARFKEFVAARFGMLIKYQNCNECSQFNSYVGKNGNLVTRAWVDPTGITYQKPHGIQFLKRCFIKVDVEGEEIVVPIRNASDMYYRVGRTPSDITNPLLELIRLHGLMLDTMGVNPVSYNYLFDMCDILLEMFPRLETDLATLSDGELKWALRDMYERFKHSGITDWEKWDLRGRPDFNKMRESMFAESLIAKKKRELFVSTPVRQSIYTGEG